MSESKPDLSGFYQARMMSARLSGLCIHCWVLPALAVLLAIAALVLHWL